MLLVGLQLLRVRWLPTRTPAAAAAPTRPVLVLAQALVVGLVGFADASGLEPSQDVLGGVVREVLINKKIVPFC